MTKNRIDGSMDGAVTLSTRTRINNNIADVGLVTSQIDYASTTTLADVSGMSTSQLNVGTYRFTVDLDTVATTNGGLKVAFKQNNGLTLSALSCRAVSFTASGLTSSRVTSTTDAASLYAASTATVRLVLTGYFIVATEGTITFQAAQNASAGGADTSSIYPGSSFRITRVGN